MKKTQDSPKILPKFKKSSSKRPFTPHIDLVHSNSIDIREVKKNNNTIKSFSSFMKQVVDSNNETFLTGEMNIIEYIISKNTGIPVGEIKSLEKLSLKINKDFDILNQFGQYLPNLIDLRLNFSVINSIEEIGSSFKNLKILQITNRIICFQQLEIIDLSYNKIFDLIEFEMCSSVKKLNLSNNLIADEENISFLSGMTSLKWLNLNENPINKLIKYDDIIKDKLPGVVIVKTNDLLSPLLDESLLEEGLKSKNKNHSTNKIKSTIVLNESNGSKTFSNKTSSNLTKSIKKDISISSHEGIKTSSIGKSEIHNDMTLELKNDNQQYHNNEQDDAINDDSQRLVNNESFKINPLSQDPKTSLPIFFNQNNTSRFKVQKNYKVKNIFENLEQTSKVKVQIGFNSSFKKIELIKPQYKKDN